MAKRSLQDKFQTSYPYHEEDDEKQHWEWAKQGALRARPVDGGIADEIAFSNLAKYKPFQNIKKRPASVRLNADVSSAAGNDPQQATDITEWVMKENNALGKVSTMSETDVTDAVSSRALLNGFTYHELDGADDQYTGEGMDHFYGIAMGPDDGGNEVEGFIERNNYLDRL